MTALLIIFSLFFLIGCIPVGILVRYDGEGAAARLVLGPVRYQLFPRKKKRNVKKGKPKKEKKAKADPPAEKAGEPAEKKGGSFRDFIPLVQVGLDFLGDLRRKLRVNLLELRLTLAGDDPADLAILYGRANAALGILWPMLERSFVIKKRDVSIQSDFTASETTVYAAMRITITIGRCLILALRYGFRALKEFMKLKNKKKAVRIK